MQNFKFPVALWLFGVACTPVEDLQGDNLKARLAGQELRFPSETDETIVMSLRADGRGEVRDILPSDRPDRVDAVSWSVSGDNLCLSGMGPGEVSSSGRTECISVAIAGTKVTLSAGDDPLVGTISPL